VQLAQTVESLRLLDDVQRRAAREQMVGQITDQMQRAYDMETLVRGTLAELQTLLGASYTVVHLGTEDTLRDKLGLSSHEGHVDSEIFQTKGEE